MSVENNYPFDQEVDARGLTCPLPILRTKKMLATMQSGQIVKVITTDKSAITDFQAFTTQTKNELITQIHTNEGVNHYIKRR